MVQPTNQAIVSWQLNMCCSGSSKRQKSQTGSIRVSPGFADELLQGLQDLLTIVEEKAMYHPTEDLKGERRMFLAKVAGRAVAAAKIRGMRQTNAMVHFACTVKCHRATKYCSVLLLLQRPEQ